MHGALYYDIVGKDDGTDDNTQRVPRETFKLHTRSRKSGDEVFWSKNAGMCSEGGCGWVLARVKLMMSSIFAEGRCARPKPVMLYR